MEVETSFGLDAKEAVEVAADGKVKPDVSKADGEGLTLEITKGGAETPAGEKPPAAAAPEAPKEEAAVVEVDEAAKPQEGMPPDLGEYKPGDEAVTSKFDAQYFTEEGKLNRDALTAEFWGNENKLRDSTYAYLTDRLGVSKELVNEIEAGLVAKHKEAEGSVTSHHAAVREVAGGEERYHAALVWGLDGGYTEEQRARFDKVVSGSEAGWEDAVLALMARYDTATGSRRKMPNLPRLSAPARDVTSDRVKAPAVASAPSTPTVAGFATEADYHQALREAGHDPRKNAAVRERLRVSPFTRS